jgi:hypothetical protein
MTYALPDPRFEMPELNTPYRKPLGPVTVDRSHPLSNNLDYFYLFGENYDAGGKYPKPSPVNATSNTWSAEPVSGNYGLYLNSAGFNPYIEMNNNNYSPFGLGYSVLFHLKHDTGGNAVFILPFSASAGTSFKIELGGFRYEHFYSGGSSGGLQSPPPGYTNNEPAAIIITAFSNGDMWTYCNGTKAPAITATGATGADQETGTWQSRLFNIGTWDRAIVGVIWSMAKWNYALSDAAALEISRNPYQVLIPK